MNDQLQLQEIAGYLPCSLRIKTKYGIDNLIGIMFSDDTDYNSTKKTTHNVNHPLANTDTHCLEFYEIKPILWPMSGLTSPMLEEAGFECHIDYLTNEFNHWVTTYGIDHVINMLPYGHAQWLYRNHFDIHNLIGRGLAISIHDIPTK